MARERDFRQRVVSTANLLLEAASMLEESREEGAPSNRVSSSRQIVQDNRTPSTIAVVQRLRRCPSLHSDLFLPRQVTARPPAARSCMITAHPLLAVVQRLRRCPSLHSALFLPPLVRRWSYVVSLTGTQLLAASESPRAVRVSADHRKGRKYSHMSVSHDHQL